MRHATAQAAKQVVGIVLVVFATALLTLVFFSDRRTVVHQHEVDPTAVLDLEEDDYLNFNGDVVHVDEICDNN